MKHEPPAKSRSISINEALHNILLQGVASSQGDLIKLLITQGYKANQSKVSRLLNKLEAVKIRNSKGDVVYSLPKEPAPPSSINNVANLIIDVVANESLIVVHTNPGSASLIARLLDYKRDELAILGTVAGDDTIFIAPISVKSITKIVIAIKKSMESNFKHSIC